MGRETLGCLGQLGARPVGLSSNRYWADVDLVRVSYKDATLDISLSTGGKLPGRKKENKYAY